MKKSEVFVKDSEGFVYKKTDTTLEEGEKIISEKEYKLASGLSYYEKTFGHGGARKNAGRKPITGTPLTEHVRLTHQEKQFIMYARENNFDYAAYIGKDTDKI